MAAVQRFEYWFQRDDQWVGMDRYECQNCGCRWSSDPEEPSDSPDYCPGCGEEVRIYGPPELMTDEQECPEDEYPLEYLLEGHSWI